MTNSRQPAEDGVLVRFWSLDHHRAEEVHWAASVWSKLVFAVEGTLQAESSERLWILPCSRALWVAAGETHRMKSLGKAKVRTLYFAPGFEMSRERGPMDVSPLLRELILETCRSGPLMAGEKCHEALAELLRQEIEQATSVQIGVPMPRTDWLHAWASAFLAYPLESPRFDYSRRTLERRISEETGLSLGRWCQHARTVVGFRVLSSGQTVSEAAAEAGYATPGSFIHAFRLCFGVTPGKFKTAA